MSQKYTEDELDQMSLEQLKDICKAIAIRCSCPLENVAPYGAHKDVLIETILEDQEEKGGNLGQRPT